MDIKVLLELLETFAVGDWLIISTHSPVKNPCTSSRYKVVFKSFGIRPNGTTVVIYLQDSDFERMEYCTKKERVKFDSNKYWQESSLKIEKA